MIKYLSILICLTLHTHAMHRSNSDLLLDKREGYPIEMQELESLNHPTQHTTPPDRLSFNLDPNQNLPAPPELIDRPRAAMVDQSVQFYIDRGMQADSNEEPLLEEAPQTCGQKICHYGKKVFCAVWCLCSVAVCVRRTIRAVRTDIADDGCLDCSNCCDYLNIFFGWN